MDDIRDRIEQQNPWWRGGWHLEYRPRRILDRIQPFLASPQVVALTGLRRVGKTTLLLRVLEEALKSKKDPRNILYFSFDDVPERRIGKVLRSYEELTGKDLNAGSFIVALDEIQKVPDWNEQLKYLYDRHKGKVKFLISGSESLFLQRGLRESLAGRMFDFTLQPLGFTEYLTFVAQGSDGQRPAGGELPRHFANFARSLGLPELAVREPYGQEFVDRFVRQNLVERILYRDLRQLLGPLDVSLLESLLRLITEEPGQVLLLPELGKELKVSRQTLSRYLRVLEGAYLVRKLYNFSGSQRKVERKLKRFYPILPSTTMTFRSDPHAQSLVFENLAVNLLEAEYFWRDPQKHEVDIVLPGPPVSALEVKYGRYDTRGLEAFRGRYPGSSARIISWDERGVTHSPCGEIEVTPLPEYLLSIGR